MKLHLDEKEYVISEALIQNNTSKILLELGKFTNQLPPMVNVMIETFARNKLYELERKIIVEGGTKEQALAFRPDKSKKETASDKLLIVLIAMLEEMLKNAQIRFNSASDGQITDFTYELSNKGETG